MNFRLFGASLLALAIATPAVAQEGATNPETSVIDDLAPAGGPDAGAAPAPTGDAVTDRLNALEYKLKQLEARNAELETQLESTNDRVQHVEVKSSKGLATNGVVPTFTDATGNVTFKVRGVIDADYVGFNERRGGYDYNSGTAFRRARLGFEGTAFKVFNWRIEADFAGNTVNLQDAYTQYAGFSNKALSVTLGQHKAPFGLESNNSDNYNVFLERGIFNNAAGTFSAERRIGLSFAYNTDTLNASVGVFGENESIGRAANAPAVVSANPAIAQPAITAANTPDEGWGVNGRVTWEPVFDTGKILHVGVSGNWRTDLRSATGVGARLSDRPNARVDGGNLIDTGIISDATDSVYLGAEAAGVWGPVTIASEYGKLRIDRAGAAPKTKFDGFYVYGTVFLTGESRAFKNGNYDRLKPFTNFNGKGGWGAWELGVRYDEADFSNTPVPTNAGNKAHTITAGLNWYWNPNVKLQFNYIRFSGDNTPLDPVGAKTKGDALATRLHIDW